MAAKQKTHTLRLGSIASAAIGVLINIFTLWKTHRTRRWGEARDLSIWAFLPVKLLMPKIFSLG